MTISKIKTGNATEIVNIETKPFLRANTQLTSEAYSRGGGRW